MTTFRQLKLTDLQIASCARWQAPDGVVYLELAHTIPFFQAVTALQNPFELELGTPPEFRFLCKVVSFTGLVPGTLVQIQWPDGRYLSNPGIDLFSFVGTGRRGRLIDPHKLMAPSAKIRMTIDNSLVAVAGTLELYFEGVLLVPMVGA